MLSSMLDKIKTFFRRFARNPGSAFMPRAKRPNFLLSVAVTTVWMIVLTVVLSGVAGMGALVGVARAYVDTSPALDIEKLDDMQQTSFIYDANGGLITTFKGIEDRVWADAGEIPDTLKKAFIAIEDARFFSHNGVDIKRIVGSFIKNLQNGTMEGGSTITQQLIKQRVLSSEQSYKRKIQEAYLAIQLETKFSKDDILTYYLNTIWLGESNYGVKAAAKDYFGKELDQLTLRECATLAALPKNPYFYNPRANYYTRQKPENTDSRVNTVLEKMVQAGYITRQQCDDGKADELSVIETPSRLALYDMPYIVEYAVTDAVQLMLRQNNLPNTKANRSAMETELRTNGYHIYTTIDPDIQHTVEDTLYNWERYPALSDPDASVIPYTNADGSVRETIQPQAAAAVIDYHTGEIKAMVGGRTAPTGQKELNRAYQAAPPVGSAIKPLAVYGPAFDKGDTAASVYYNIPAPIEGWDSETGFPRNYSGGSYTGATTIRTGLLNSYNVIAARVLLEKVGLDEAASYLTSLGIDNDGISVTGSGLALGTSGISVLDMAGAFSAIANLGMYQEPIAITSIEDHTGNVVVDGRAAQAKRQVFLPSTSWQLVDLLVDAVNRGTGTNARIDGITVGGKTGTNSEYRGATFSGFTPYYAASVWVGHDDYIPLASGSTGSGAAAPIWQDFMSTIHEGLENKPIISQSPEELGLVKMSFCPYTGLLASPYCTLGGVSANTEYVRADSIPDMCTAHRSVTICSVSKQPAGIYCPLTEIGTVFVITKDSPLYTVDRAVLAQYFPSAVIEEADGTVTPVGTCTQHLAPVVPYWLMQPESPID